MDDLIEIIIYLSGFWRFIFSKEFRVNWLASYQSSSALEKTSKISEALISTLVSLGLPILIVYLVLI